jgi:thymidylate synthase (FAD)
VPLTCESFLQHRLHAVTFSAGALAVVKRMLAGETPTQQMSGLSKREWRELMGALGREG